MRFDTKTEDEIKRGALLKVGICDFEVKKASDEISKTSGKEMIKLLVALWDEDGETGTAFDYLMDAMPGKLRHFCYAAGIGAQYEAGELTAELCQGLSGKCKIKHEIDKTGQYEPKNAIVDYIVAEAPPVLEKKPENTQKADMLKAAKLAAANAMAKKMPGASKEAVADAVKDAVAACFPGKTIEQLGTVQWQALVKQDFAPIESPVSASKEFADDDIPF